MSTTSQSTPAMAWLLCFMTSLFYAFQYILRLLPSVIKDDLMLNYLIDAKDFGYFNGFYYAGYSLFHLPVGVMLDRIGPKYTISLSLFLCGLGIIPPLFSDSWTIAVIGRFLLGGGSVTAILALFYVIRINFPPVRFASILGMSATLGLSGALFGSRPIGILNEMVGWKNVIWILCATSIILAVLFLICMPNQKDHSAQAKTSIVSDIKELLHNKHVWAVSLLAGLMVGSLEGFADAWGVSFLQTVYELNQADAQFIPSLMFFGFAFGAPLIGYLGEKYKKPYTVIIICALCKTLIFTGMLMFKIQNILFLYAIMIIMGALCAGYQIFMIFINTRIVDPRLVGVVISFTNMVVMSFGVIFHSGIGWIIDQHWEGRMIHDLPIYSSEAYISGLAIIPIGLLIAFFGFIVIKPKDESALLKDNT